MKKLKSCNHKAMHVLTNVANDDLNEGIGYDVGTLWVSIDFGMIQY